MTTLKITPLSNKSASVTGIVVVVEPVSVTLVGLAAYISTPNQLRIRLRSKGIDIARFPEKDGDVWTVSGSDATCTLDTNTVQALSIFGSGCCTMGSRECTVLVEKITAPKALFCSATINIKNWPQVSGADVPYNLATWPDDLAAVEDALADQVQAFESHSHTAGSPTQVSHGDLLNAGSVTHAVLETSIAALEASMTEAEGEITVLQKDLNDAGVAFAAHNHDGTTSQQLSHAGLSGIGTRTHAQLEADTHAVDVKADAIKSAYDAHAHTGADGSPKVAFGSIEGMAVILTRLAAAETALVAANAAIAALDAAVIKKSTTQYTVTAPQFGSYRNIREDMTGDQLSACLPTIVADLQAKGVL